MLLHIFKVTFRSPLAIDAVVHTREPAVVPEQDGESDGGHANSYASRDPIWRCSAMILSAGTHKLAMTLDRWKPLNRPCHLVIIGIPGG